MKPKNRYAAIIERIFASKFKAGMREVDFARDEIETVARQLRIKLPKNLGDLIYSSAIVPICPNPSRKRQRLVRFGSFGQSERPAIASPWLSIVPFART